MLTEVHKWFEAEDFGDTTIVASDGQKFRCHKDILARRSEVFKLMFSSGLKESIENIVNINHFNGEIISSLLSFIYIDDCGNIWQIAERLYAAAHKYQLERLKSLCESSMASNLSAKSIVKTYRLATFFHLDQLLSTCVDYMGNHKSELSISDILAEALKIEDETEIKVEQK